MTYDQGSKGEARAQKVDRLLERMEAAGQRCDVEATEGWRERDERAALAIVAGVTLALTMHAEVMRAILKEVLDHE